MGELLELARSEAGDTESKYQFVDVREEPELAQAKLDGEMSTVGGSRRGAGSPTPCTSITILPVGRRVITSKFIVVVSENIDLALDAGRYRIEGDGSGGHPFDIVHSPGRTGEVGGGGGYS